MLKHREYQHIVNSSVGSFLRKQGPIKEAQVEEKIDGSNFCFVTDGREVKVARRSDFLKDDEIFFNFQALQHRKERGIEHAKKACLALYPELLPHEPLSGKLHLYIYGELIPTQKRLKYTQTDRVHFVVFEVLLVLAEQEEEKKSESGGFTVPPCPSPLDRVLWEEVLQEHGFLVNPILFTGSLQECLAYDVETTKSIVPKLLGEGHEVAIEGVVIKAGRFVVKKKATAFAEIERGRQSKMKKVKDPKVMEVAELIESMLVDSRLDNIISRIGTAMVPDSPRLTTTFVLDAIMEAKDDDDSVVHKISSSQLNKIKKELTVLYTDYVEEKMGWKK